MTTTRWASWRTWLAIAGILIVVGGPMHPGGATMAEMLGNPNWVPAHVLVFLALAALLVGLRAFGRTAPAAVRGWNRLAMVGTALELVELAFHTAAVRDHANLVAGRATPVLGTHLALALVCYPAFGVSVAALVVAAARERAIGSPWIAPLGVVGVLAYGMAPPLMRLAPSWNLRVLFPLILLFALWLLLAAVWRPAARAASPSLWRAA